METLLGTLAGILFGGLISYFISRFYYKKTIKVKTLSCYVQYISEFLTDIDEDVKKKLEIDYDGQKVNSIYQVQFIIANTGDFPIRDIIRPLTLKIPNQAEVLDANIIHIEPNGREVSLKTTKNTNENVVEFQFPLLNSSDYFVTKLLVKGEAPRPQKIKKEDASEDDDDNFLSFNTYNLFKFNITVDDLPPEILSERLPHDYSYYQKEAYDKSTLWGGAIFGALAFILGYVLFCLKELKSDLFLFHFSEFFTNFSFYKFCVIIGWIITLLFSLFAIIIPLIGFSDLTNNKPKTKFKLPSKLSENRGRRIGYFD